MLSVSPENTVPPNLLCELPPGELEGKTAIPAVWNDANRITFTWLSFLMLMRDFSSSIVSPACEFVRSGVETGFVRLSIAATVTVVVVVNLSIALGVTLAVPLERCRARTRIGDAMHSPPSLPVCRWLQAESHLPFPIMCL